MHWAGPVPSKDDFGHRITDTFIDGRTQVGPWAIMTPCRNRYGTWARQGAAIYQAGGRPMAQDSRLNLCPICFAKPLDPCKDHFGRTMYIVHSGRNTGARLQRLTALAMRERAVCVPERDLDHTNLSNVHEAYRRYITHQWAHVDKRPCMWTFAQ